MKKRVRITLLVSTVVAALVPILLEFLISSEMEGRLWVIAGISLVIAAAAAWFAIRSIAVPLDRLSETTRLISQGDLTKRVDGLTRSDEIGILSNHIQRMVDNLNDMITSVRDTTNQVTASAGQLSAGAEQTTKAIQHVTVAIQEMASGSEQQKNSIETGIKGVEEMSSQAVIISEHIRTFTETMERTREVAEEGNTSVISVVEKIEHIQHTVEELGTVIETLGGLTENIGGMAEMITGIAKQTNMLALNASIEAARAGEQGKGFAVVASEVRKLAEGSEKSAHQIEDLIGGIQSEVRRALDSMENAKRGVEEGIIAVDTSGRSFSRIRKAVRGTSEKIEGVLASAQELAAGAGRVSESISGIRVVAEESAGNTQTISAAAEEQLASIEEVASSSAELSRMAAQLQEQAGKFKVRK